MHWMLMPLKRYAQFSGRSRRTEYWMFVLFQILFVAVAAALWFALIGIGPANSDTLDASESQLGGLAIAFMIVVGTAYLLLFFIPTLAVQVRRLHDQNLTGWLWLLGLVPYVGGIILFVFMLIPGTRGPNRFGPDPRDPSDPADVFA